MPLFIKKTVALGRCAKRKLAAWWKRREETRVRAEISRLLERQGDSIFLDSDELFNALQQAYDPLPEYGYDQFSTWRRGFQRALALLDHPDLRKVGLVILEAACGDGMTGYALASYGHYCLLNDIEDWRDPRAKSLPFVLGDMCLGLPLASGTFDLVCSYNSFEHVEDPEQALAELMRVSKKGALIYLHFGPLYCSPWGLHAYRTLRMPYPQFLFSPTFIDEKLRKLGIRDLGRQMSKLQPLNRWRLEQFQRLWRESGCLVESLSLHSEYAYLDVVKRYPQAFRGYGLTFEDVTITSISVLLRTP
jgi:SAM-dependent methyltransferase